MRFPGPRANWIPSAITAVVSLILLAGTGSLTVATGLAVVIGSVAGLAVAFLAAPRKKVRVQSRAKREGNPVPRPSAAPSATLVSALEGSFEGGRSLSDLRRVLAGIAADESGRIDPSTGDSLVVVFASHSSALDAAHRMVSNVEALSARTGRPLRIAIGIHSEPVAPGDFATIATQLRELSASKRASVIVEGPVQQPEPAALEVATA